MTHVNKRFEVILALIILSIPLGLFLLWIYACNQTGGYPENVNLYNSYLPEVLRGRFTTTLLSLVLCIAAVVLALRNLDNATKLQRALSWFVVVGGGLLGFLNLFSMM